MPESVVVRHATGHYPVYVGAGALNSLTALVRAHLPGRAVALITDSTVGRLYEEWESGATGRWRADAAPLAEQDPHNWATRLSLPPGEATKTRASWMELSDLLFEHGLGRDGGLLALGGGVVGDLAGFVAATFMRGIPYVQVPTTMVAMLDASVGGKTGVDTPRGKNLIGAFHPPAAVVADPVTLRTLGERDYIGGLSEAIKHGLVADAGYLDMIEREAEALVRRDPGVLGAVVLRSIEIKAAIVAADEREQGRRAVLNAGHTVAHAVEHLSDYRVGHGDAVALGLLAETAMAERLGLADGALRPRLVALFGRLGLPVRLPTALLPERLVTAMAFDKKNRDRRIHCALPAAAGVMAGGDGRWTVPVDHATLLAGLATIK